MHALPRWGFRRLGRGLLSACTAAGLSLAGAAAHDPAQAQTTNIDTAQPFYLGSQVGISVNPVFQGGTLRLDQANGSYPQNFTLDGSATNTIDQFGNTSTFSGVFSNAVPGTPGNLTIANSGSGGSVTFTAAQTYTGTTTVATGTTLTLAGTTALSNGLGGFTVNGTLNSTSLYGSLSIGSLSGTGRVNLLSTSASTFLAIGTGSGTFSGSITGIDGISIAGTETLTALNTYTGETYIATGATLNLAGAGSIARSAATIDGTLDISGTAAGATVNQLSGAGAVNLGRQTLTVTNGGNFSGTLSGTGGLAINGGMLTLSGNNLYSGGTTVNNATLTVNGDAALGAESGSLMLNQATLLLPSNLSLGRNIVLSESNVVNTYDHTVTLAGAISGTGTLTVTGHGSATLSAANPFSGEVVIDSSMYNFYPDTDVTTLSLSGNGNLSAATVVLQEGLAADNGAGNTKSIFDISATNNGASVASLAGNGTVNLGTRTLTLGNAGGTFAGTVQGTGAIAIDGGSETLTGANTYTGVTTIAPGATLALSMTGGIGASSGVVADGTLDVSNAGAATPYGPSITTLSGSGSVILGPGLVLSSASGTFSGSITAPGLPTPTPAGSGVNFLDLPGTYASGHGAGITVIDAATGVLTIGGGNETLSGTFSGGALSVSSGANLVLAGSETLTAPYGLSIDGTFDASAMSNGITVGTLSGTGVVALGSGTLTINNAGHVVLVESPSPYAGTPDFGDGWGDICVCITLAQAQLVAGLTYDTFSGTLTGTGGLAITGGMEALTGTNTYQGGTAVSNAVLGVNSDAALGAASGGLALENSTFVALAPLTSSRSVTVTGVAGFDTNQFGVTFTGPIGGSGMLSVTGGGTLTLTGNNSFAGGTIVNSATLAVNADSALGAPSGSLALTNATLSALADLSSDRTVALSGANTLATGGNTVTLSGEINGDGGLTASGGGRVVLGAPDAFSGPTTIDSGTTLALAAAGSIAASSGLTDNGTFDISAAPQDNTVASLTGTGNVTLGTSTLTVANASGSFSGTISGSGSLAVTGGTQTLTGTNTYSGGTTIRNATLAINADAALGAPSGGVLLDNGTLRALANLTSARAFATTAAGGTIDTNGFDVALTGPLSLSGSLATIGSGALSISGPTSADSAFTMTNGVLAVDSAFIATSLTIGSDGTLRGTGTVDAPTTVFGLLAPGHSPGTLTFTAPLTLAPGSTTGIDIDGTGTGTGAGSYSRIVVLGTGNPVSLDGTLLPLLRGITGSATNSYTPPLGQQFQIMASQGGVSGSFASLVQPTGLPAGTRFDTIYSPNAVTLAVTPAEYGDLQLAGLAETSGEASLGTALDAVRPAAGPRPDPASAALFDPLYALPGPAIPSALAQLAPDIYADGLMAGRETWYRMTDAVAGQLASRQSPACAVRPQPAACAAAANAATAPGPDGSTVWASGLGEFDQVSSGGEPGYRLSIGGAMAGIDGPVASGSTVGFAVGGGSVQTTANNGAAASGTAVQFDIYGSMQRGPLFVDAQAAYLHLDQDARRTLSAWDTAARGSEPVNGGGIQVNAGTRLSFDRWQIEPTLGMSVASFVGSAVNETTGGVLASQVGGQSVTSIQSFAGLRIGTAFRVASRVPLHLQALLGWTHEFDEVASTTTASLDAVGAGPFPVASAPISRDAARLGISAAVPVSPAVSLYAAYAASLSTAETAQDITGGIRVLW